MLLGVLVSNPELQHFTLDVLLGVVLGNDLSEEVKPSSRHLTVGLYHIGMVPREWQGPMANAVAAVSMSPGRGPAVADCTLWWDGPAPSWTLWEPHGL